METNMARVHELRVTDDQANVLLDGVREVYISLKTDIEIASQLGVTEMVELDSYKLRIVEGLMDKLEMMCPFNRNSTLDDQVKKYLGMIEPVIKAGKEAINR